MSDSRQTNNARGGLERLQENASLRLVQAEAALRHAHMALKMGKHAEALVVLEALDQGVHLDAAQLELLIAAKEADLLAEADRRDDENLERAARKAYEAWKKNNE